MPKYRVYGAVSATKYIGEFEADDKEHAEEMAWKHDNASVSVCHQCSSEVDGAEMDELVIEYIEGDSE